MANMDGFRNVPVKQKNRWNEDSIPHNCMTAIQISITPNKTNVLNTLSGQEMNVSPL
ncbi:MAG: hypothetical protein NC080_10925 [Paraprevotella sp.]|nr:hypothetical protein [Paraprevotella sp.]